MQYDFEIQYISGKNIPHADALSRLKFKDESETEDEMKAKNTLSVFAVQFQESLLDENIVRTETKLENLTKRILNRIITGNWQNCSQAERQFKLVSDRLTIEKGLIYYGSRLFIPMCLRRQCFDIVHGEVHSGTKSTQYLLKTTSWWPSIQEDINKFVR